MARQRRPRATTARSGGDSGASECLARALSDIELLAAADVIRSAISEGRKHVDLEALKAVLDKLTSAYELRKHADH